MRDWYPDEVRGLVEALRLAQGAVSSSPARVEPVPGRTMEHMDQNRMEQELPGTEPGAGTGLAPVDPVEAAAQVRMWATTRLRNLVETLDPYVNGTLGEVSPRHAQVYLATVKEINRLWGASRVPVPEPVEEEAKVQERAIAVRNRVLAQLEELRTRT